MKKSLAALVGAATLALAPAAADAATPEPVVCNGTIRGQVVGAVTVPFGTDCTLKNVIVLGDLIGDPNAGNVTLRQTVVRGNAELIMPASLDVRASGITGTLNVVQSYGEVSLSSSAVGGDVSLGATLGALHLGDAAANEVGNVFGGSVLIQSSFEAGTIHANVVAEDLTLLYSEAQLSVSRNLVRGSLDCSDNAVEPVGGRNAAAQKLGQCAAL